MRVVVTRPLAQAATWVADLRAHGIDAVALPLIAIGGPPDRAAVAAAWESLASRRLVVFVSPNAAASFFAARPDGVGWPAGVGAAAPGPGTADLLRAHGVPAARIVEPAADAPQFDSESLWARLEADDWNAASVLLVRGRGGRDWLAARLRERGARVDALAAYARALPVFDAAAKRLLAEAVAAPALHAWLFSSSEAIDNLVAHCAATGAPGASTWAAARAIATHPRIARRARDAGFSEVIEARPSLASVVACIQSMQP